jgi:hypothetical protein
MSVSNYEELAKHYGHKIVIAKYGKANVAIECETCNVVLLDFDKECGRLK